MLELDRLHQYYKYGYTRTQALILIAQHKKKKTMIEMLVPLIQPYMKNIAQSFRNMEKEQGGKRVYLMVSAEKNKETGEDETVAQYFVQSEHGLVPVIKPDGTEAKETLEKILFNNV